jgi:hypothetical protein
MFLMLARQLLEEGKRYWYYPDARVLSCHELTLKLLREDGDDSQARELADRIEAIQKRPDSTDARPAEATVSSISPAHWAPG